jgi:hypothetical protein
MVLGGLILVCVTIAICAVQLSQQIQDLKEELRNINEGLNTLQQDDALGNQWQLDELPAIHSTLKTGVIALLATRKRPEVQISDASDERIKEARDSFSSVYVSNFLAEAAQELNNSETQQGTASEEGTKN